MKKARGEQRCTRHQFPFDGVAGEARKLRDSARGQVAARDGGPAHELSPALKFPPAGKDGEDGNLSGIEAEQFANPCKHAVQLGWRGALRRQLPSHCP